MQTVAKALDEVGLKDALDRQRRLAAALALVLGGNQSELHRRLAKIEPRLALGTVQAWCRPPKPIGTGTPMTELTLRGILCAIGLPSDWDPNTAASQ